MTLSLSLAGEQTTIDKTMTRLEQFSVQCADFDILKCLVENCLRS